MFGDAWPSPAPDMTGIQEPIDFLGINYYTRGIMRDAATPFPPGAVKVPQRRKISTETHWEVHPAGLTGALEWVRRRYGTSPLYVTENGAAFYDAPSSEDLEPDLLRVRYLRDHIAAAGRAIEAGVDLRGYFVWSLFDNLEWSHGFSKRFGIVPRGLCDAENARQRRAPGFYADVIRANGAISERELPPAPSARRARSPPNVTAFPPTVTRPGRRRAAGGARIRRAEPRTPPEIETRRPPRLLPHREIEPSPARAQPAHRDSSVSADPVERHPPRREPARVLRAFVGEEVEKRTDVIRPHPAVRHVADELRRAGIAPDDLRPLVPLRRPAVREKKVRELLRAAPSSPAG
jgi:hypothetical protein